jgi:hypothetical protein
MVVFVLERDDDNVRAENHKQQAQQRALNRWSHYVHHRRFVGELSRGILV